MKPLDRYLQRWRMRQAMQFIPDQARVIDVGAHDGELFVALGDRLHEGFGIDPLRHETLARSNFTVVPGYFPASRPPTGGWDAVTMLAVLEHVPVAEQPALASACHGLLKPGGRVIVTVPSRAVDPILAGLRLLRLIDGMSLEQHYGFRPADTPRVFTAPGFRLLHRSRFQAGLNHLFVFERLS